MTPAETLVLAFAGFVLTAYLCWRYVYCPLRELFYGDGGAR